MIEDLVNVDLLKSEKEFYTIEEVLKTLNVSENTLYRYIKRGKLSPIKFRNRNYFRKDDLVGYISKLFEVQL